MLGVVEDPKYAPFTVSGYFDFDHIEALAEAALTWTSKAAGCYTTINPVAPDVLARAVNRVIKRPKHTTNDEEILRRFGLVFDADPKRPAGVSATDDEKSLASNRINKLVDELTRRGWPAPVVVDSGNGFHARYRIDLANNAGALAIVERVLKVASVLFSDDEVTIDTSLSNASRIIKLPGTIARKGDHTYLRPHRGARILSAPPQLGTIPVDLLEAFAAQFPSTAVSPSPGRPQENSPWIRTAKVGATAEDRARAYVFAPGFPDSVAGSNGHGRLFHVANVLVDNFGLDVPAAMPILRDWNQAKAQPPESEKQLVHKLNSAIKKHPIPSCDKLNADGKSVGNGPNAQSTASQYGRAPRVGNSTLVTISASTIQPRAAEFLDGGMIPKGKLITLAGLGGAGKGMFWVNLVADLTQGRPTLGLSYHPPPPIEVLLIGCEESYEDAVAPRLLAASADMKRIHILKCVSDGQGKTHPFSLRDLDALDIFLGEHPNVHLVMIDPITGYVGRAGVKDHHDAELRSLLEPLAELADRRATTVMASKHLNKDEAKTVASRVGGSVAYVNVPRACFVVAKDPKDESRRVLAPFKWNLNVPMPPSIAMTMEPPCPGDVATILARCNHLGDEGKAKLGAQLYRLTWVGKVDESADELLKTAARVERQSTKDEVGRATEWLRQRLADGPVGSILCAQEGDRDLGRTWPAPSKDVSPDELNRRRLGRVKWWRETVLKAKLGGESKRAGFGGPWFFSLSDHSSRGLWPPSAEAIQVAQCAADRELPPSTQANPWPMTIPMDSAVDASIRSQSNKAETTAPTDSTVHQSGVQAENASTASMAVAYQVVEAIESVESIESIGATLGATPSTADSTAKREVFIV
jgi:hypothetical protein